MAYAGHCIAGVGQFEPMHGPTLATPAGGGQAAARVGYEVAREADRWAQAS